MVLWFVMVWFCFDFCWCFVVYLGVVVVVLVLICGLVRWCSCVVGLVCLLVGGGLLFIVIVTFV